MRVRSVGGKGGLGLVLGEVGREGREGGVKERREERWGCCGW